jgi:crotonobetainyl-CoA:carnitine CoA-transferase CaiB-like acyl-CoA transferase
LLNHGLWSGRTRRAPPRERSGTGQHIDVTMAETMLATNEFTAVEVNGGFGDEISPFRPGRAALVQLRDGRWIQFPGNPTTSIFGVARALGKEDELSARGWRTHADTQGADDEIRALMQTWAEEYGDAESFERALDAVRIPLGTVKRLSDVVREDWAEHRQALAEIDINGTTRLLHRSPARFSDAQAGPRSGVRLRGADNRRVLRERLALSDTELDRLKADGVLLEESYEADSAG